MNNKRLTWMSLIVILVLVLTACARAEVIEDTPEPPVVEQPVVVEPTPTDEEPTATEPPTVEPTEVEETEEPTVTPTEATDDEDERMIALITEKVGDCHAVNRVLNSTKTREAWSTTIDRMIGYGANINAEEKEMIIDWLVSREQ